MLIKTIRVALLAALLLPIAVQPVAASEHLTLRDRLCMANKTGLPLPREGELRHGSTNLRQAPSMMGDVIKRVDIQRAAKVTILDECDNWRLLRLKGQSQKYWVHIFRLRSYGRVKSGKQGVLF